MFRETYTIPVGMPVYKLDLSNLFSDNCGNSLQTETVKRPTTLCFNIIEPVSTDHFYSVYGVVTHSVSDWNRS